MKKATIKRAKWQRVTNKLNKSAAAAKCNGRFTILEEPGGDIVIEYKGSVPISGTKKIKVSDAKKTIS